MSANMINGFYIIRNTNTVPQDTAESSKHCKKLRDYIDRHGLTIKALADKIGVSTATVHNCIYHGRRNSPSRLSALLVSIATDGEVHPADILPTKFDRTGVYTKDDIHPLVLWLRANRMSVSVAADKLGMSVPRLTRILKGTTKCRSRIAEAIEQLTSCEISASILMRNYSHVIYM